MCIYVCAAIYCNGRLGMVVSWNIFEKDQRVYTSITLWDYWALRIYVLLVCMSNSVYCFFLDPALAEADSSNTCTRQTRSSQTPWCDGWHNEIIIGTKSRSIATIVLPSYWDGKTSETTTRRCGVQVIWSDFSIFSPFSHRLLLTQVVAVL